MVEIGELLREVLEVQRDYSPDKTPDMERRGDLIRSDLTRWLRDRLPHLRADGVDDLRAGSSAGAGRPSEIPWARVYSMSRSPGATEGWYVVYLFDGLGKSVFLCLIQGTTRWTGSAPKTRPLPELRTRTQWARDELATHLALRPDLVFDIDLKARGRKLAPGYEAGTVAAFEYRRDTMPSAAVLEEDLAFLVSVLGPLHAIVESSLDLPGEPSPDVSDAITLVDEAAGRRGGSGQGTRLTQAERRAIEQHSVAEAMRYLIGEGYTVADVGATESYDIRAARVDVAHLYVEVKGTTSLGEEVILTRNEVELNAEKHPDTMLIVVSGIDLDRTATPPVASGGTLRAVHPWRAEPADLTPIAYRYKVNV